MRLKGYTKSIGTVVLGLFNLGLPHESSAQLSARITSTKKEASAAPAPVTPKLIYFYIPPSPGASPTPSTNPTTLGGGLGVSCDTCTWTVKPWLTHNVSVSNDGVFVGTPDEVQVFGAHITQSKGTYTKVGGSSVDVPAKEYDVTIEVLPSNNLPAIVTASFPAQPLGQPYAETLTALEAPHAGHYLWSVDPASLPPGLSADANGNITGTPTTAGAYSMKATVTDANGKSSSATVLAQIDKAPGCTEVKYTNAYFNGWFPLSRKVNTDPLGAGTWQYMTDNDVQCFYQANGPTAALTQVQYIYGFGGGANTLSADMVSFQVFAPVGTQVSLGTSVTGGSNQNSTTPSTTPTTASALQSVEAGGDFYFHILYPITVGKSDHVSFVSAIDPKFGFSFNGFAGQNTLSQGTEQYFNVPLEINGSLNGILNQGGAFFDYRGGLESVPGGFAKAAGLTHHNFYLNQLSFGIKFGGVIQIGAQHFWGPPAAFNADNPTGFNKWHLILQLNPQI